VQSICASILLGFSIIASAELSAQDPLDSMQWESLHEKLLGGEPIVFDPGVRVVAPGSAEDSLNVPVLVDASAVSGIERILVFADYNPIPMIVDFRPVNAEARIGLRFKIQQASPVRAAVLAGDGTWHVGGLWVDAAGGGCTLPSVGSSDDDWAARLGEVSGRLWPRSDGQRLRFSVAHPMDTGLAPGIAAFYIEDIEITDGSGRVLAQIKPFEPMAENPIFSLDVPASDSIQIRGRDNNGNRFGATVKP
jgi:sulfur-oxidizing protein SoxY